MTIKPAHLRWKDNGTPESKDFGDIYFSVEDGMAETRTVFIEGTKAASHWQHYAETIIGETGFGTGLNLLTTWHDFLLTAPAHHRLHFISFEGFPLSLDDLEKAHKSFPALAPLAQKLRDQYPPLADGFHRLEFEDGRVSLTLILGLIDETIPLLKGQIDCWYLDGFAPSKNPDMWSETLFQNLFRLSHPETTLATFTAAGMVKRGLENAGFDVQKTKGFGKKRERILATIKKDTTLPSKIATPEEVTIIGGGIAGSLMAHQLKNRGLKTTLIEKTKIANGASGNPAGLISPKITLGTDPQADFMAKAYMFAMRFYQKLHQSNPGLFIDTPSALKKAASMREQAQFNKLATKDSWHHDYLSCVDQGDGNFSLSFKPCFTVRPDQLTHHFANEADQLIIADIQSLKNDAGLWSLYDDQGALIHQTSCLVITAGFETKNLLHQFNMETVAISHSRGQISLIEDQPHYPSGALYQGAYLSPAFDQPTAAKSVRLLGASFDRETDLDDPEYNTPRPSEHESVFQEVLTPYQDDNTIANALEYRVSTRAMILDHMPIMGPAFKAEALCQNLPKAPELKDMTKRLPNAQYDNLFILAGLGSRGLMTAPLLTTALADLISNTPSPLSQKVALALDPARFLIKDIVRGKKAV